MTEHAITYIKREPKRLPPARGKGWHFGGSGWTMAKCSCGWAGLTHTAWLLAECEARDHLAAS